MILKEFCAENFTDVPLAIERGAQRIELCDNLAVGGTTPSVGVMAETVNYAHKHGAKVMAMIRPRGGDFVYTDTELHMMERDIQAAVQCDVDGCVFGTLTQDDWIDVEALKRLIKTANGKTKFIRR